MAALCTEIGYPRRWPDEDDEPRLRLIGGSDTTVRRRRAALRRRLATTVITVAALVGLWFASGVVVAPAASRAGEPAPRPHVVAGVDYLVARGDTLSSIAAGVAPSGERAAVVAVLRSELHGRPLLPGTVLRLP